MDDGPDDGPARMLVFAFQFDPADGVDVPAEELARVILRDVDNLDVWVDGDGPRYHLRSTQLVAVRQGDRDDSKWMLAQPDLVAGMAATKGKVASGKNLRMADGNRGGKAKVAAPRHRS